MGIKTSCREAQGACWSYTQEAAVDGHHHEKTHLDNKHQTRSFVKDGFSLISGPVHFAT